MTGIPVRLLPFLFLTPALVLFNNSAIGATNPSIVELQTTVGTITIQLNYAKAPIASKNFISYAGNGFYKNTLFHRVISGFMMQGGGFDKATGQQKPANAPIKNEANNGLQNLKGTIAMARTEAPDSATSQFFINFADNANLNASKSSAGYAVFGKVIKGMGVVDHIGRLTSLSIGNVPYTEKSELLSLDNVYLSSAINKAQSATRITVKGGGHVVSLPAGINCGTQCVLKQSAGAALKLNAVPDKLYQFAGWRGDCRGLSATLLLDTKRGNHNCTALFSKAESRLQ